MNKVGKIVNMFFIIFMGYVLIAKCAYLFDILSFIVAIGGTVAVFLLLYFWVLINDSFERLEGVLKNLTCKRMMLILLVCSLVSKIGLTYILQITSIASHGDIQVYVTTAKELATTGVVSKYAGYCYDFSHMFWFSMFLTPVVYLFGDSQIVCSLYIALVSTITLLLVFDLVAVRVSKERAFFISMILCFLPSQLLQNQYITHEHALLLFLTVAVWLYFRVLPNCQNMFVRAICFLLFIVSLFFAYLMNTAGIVMVIAFVILFFIKIFNGLSMRSILKGVLSCALLIAVIVLGSSFSAKIQLNKSALPADYVGEDKFLWTLYVGANSETSAHWSEEDTKSFSAYSSDATIEEINRFKREALTERYRDLLSHPKKLISLIRDKSITIWSCFNYPIGFTNETIKSPALQSLYNRLFKPLMLLEYGASLIAAVWCFISNLSNHNRFVFSDRYLIIELYLMGTTAMLLLTECNNKYTLAMQPFFWMACFALSRKKTAKTEINARNRCIE